MFFYLIEGYLHKVFYYYSILLSIYIDFNLEVKLLRDTVFDRINLAKISLEKTSGHLIVLSAQEYAPKMWKTIPTKWNTNEIAINGKFEQCIKYQKKFQSDNIEEKKIICGIAKAFLTQ